MKPGKKPVETEYLETSEKTLLSFPPALPRGRNALSGGTLRVIQSLKTDLKWMTRGAPLTGADCPNLI